MRYIPPVESLVDALHDPIHPASGSLIRSQTVKGSGGVDKTDIVCKHGELDDAVEVALQEVRSWLHSTCTEHGIDLP